MADELNTQNLCERYERLYTGLVADILDEYGYQNQTFRHDLNPISQNMTAAGIAYPIVGRSNQNVNPDDQIRNFLEMLGKVPSNSVLVVKSNDKRSSQVGELTTSALENQGCRGVIVEGGLRDTEYVLDQEFPVFAQYRTPADSVPRWELVETNTTTVMGNVLVSPGDLIFGDIDGIVAVPQEIATEVLRDAEEEKETEDQVRAAIANGSSPLDAFDQFGTF